MFDHVLKHEEELLYIIIEKKINGKKDGGCPRTAYIKNTIQVQ